jgi:hypothetical protein
MPMAMRNSNRRKLLHNHMQSNSSSNANEYVMIEQELGVHRCITTALTAMQERKRAQEREQERLAAEKASQVVDRRGIELAALTQKLEPLALKIKHVCTVLLLSQSRRAAANQLGHSRISTLVSRSQPMVTVFSMPLQTS